MSRCRVASRVALREAGRFPCIQPVLATILATKVSPFQLHPSRPSRAGRPESSSHSRLPSADVGRAGAGAAAGLAAWAYVGGDGCRVASSWALPPTPLIIAIFVTNGDFSGDAS